MFKYLACLLSLLGATGCLSVDVASLLRPQITEQTLQEADSRTSDKVLLIDLHGVITTEPEGRLSLVPRTSPDSVKAALSRAEKDKDIRAVILRIDSPGGGVTASDMIFHELLSFKQRTGLPMVASVLNVGASGGYYVACAADEIHAHPTSIVGSIGVIARLPKLQGLADKIGYEEIIIKSGEMKDLGHPLQEMSPEERAVLQGIIDDAYERFLTVIVGQRDAFADAAVLRPLADGRVYTASQAVSNRLIDGTAYLPETIDRAMTLAGIEDAHVVSYRLGAHPDATIYSVSSPAPTPSFNAIQVDLGEFSRPQLGIMYLWWPGR